MIDPVYAVFLAAQTGALIFYAGSTSRTLKDHERRIGKQETTCEKCGRVVVQLATKEGVQL